MILGSLGAYYLYRDVTEITLALIKEKNKVNYVMYFCEGAHAHLWVPNCTTRKLVIDAQRC